MSRKGTFIWNQSWGELESTRKMGLHDHVNMPNSATFLTDNKPSGAELRQPFCRTEDL